MRVVGIALVILGAVALGYGGFTYVTRENVVDAGPVQITADREKTVWVPPVICGIAVVAGLLVLATSGRREAAL
jgi:hypothetical protein